MSRMISHTTRIQTVQKTNRQMKWMVHQKMTRKLKQKIPWAPKTNPSLILVGIFWQLLPHPFWHLSSFTFSMLTRTYRFVHTYSHNTANIKYIMVLKTITANIHRIMSNARKHNTPIISFLIIICLYLFLYNVSFSAQLPVIQRGMYEWTVQLIKRTASICEGRNNYSWWWTCKRWFSQHLLLES